ncbi:hypothetical protein ATANTOWER_013755 [Ataeniobius toweri]|uniref:Ig-like domain-containing protein n=1 Tax=Ataeniobius toweri TaxID=208326 RepID=A0ABU7BIJ7_9TELE|nr:hypothetical protein [Ataeniobius toweri]
MDVIHSFTLPMHTLYSQVQAPVPPRGNQPSDPGGGPLPSWGRDRQTAPAPPRPGRPRPGPRPEPSPQQPPSTSGEGAMYKRGDAKTWNIVNDFTENIVLKVDPKDPVVEGSNVTLMCVADGNPPPTSFNFDLKGELVKVKNANTYTITNISRNNSGEYKCSLADNPSMEATMNITVNFLDIKLYLNKTVIRRAGGSLNLSLDIDSSAKPTVSWTKGGVKMNKEPKSTELAYSDAGFYELEVTMGPLRRKASFHLIVEGNV